MFISFMSKKSNHYNYKTFPISDLVQVKSKLLS